MHKKYTIFGSLLAVAIVLASIISIAYVGTSHNQESHAATPAVSCTVSSLLVNSCRPWLGAKSGAYDLPAGTADTPLNQLTAHEDRIGRQVDISHIYHTAGQALNKDDKTMALRAGTYVFMDWKPAADWATGSDTSNATTNASIDTMAASVKSLGTKKLFITVWHEPQNDVNAGLYPCTAASGKSGTPAQYRAMWQNVRDRFTALGVTNVVWAIDYQSYEPLDCMIDDLYPGDNLVDWIVFNGYGNNTHNDFTANVQHYYDFFTTHTDATHSYTSKKWGMIEWGLNGSSAAAGVQYYKDAKTALDTNIFPRLKMYAIFDSIGPDVPVKDYRVAYDGNSVFSQAKQDAYTAFAHDPRFTDAYYEQASGVIGDITGDGRVNALDLSVLISHDGQPYTSADLNGDGTVGAADLAIVLGHWTW